MISPATNEVLNRLLATINRSLPMYLVEACPWRRAGDEPAEQTLKLIVDDQRQTVDRLAHFILDENGVVDTGDFPLHFTRFNDLSLDFCVQEMLIAQVKDIVKIEQCVEQLADHPKAKALAQEAYGAALAHLDSLKELATG